jgi:REP-associated tyrosine transposase
MPRIARAVAIQHPHHITQRGNNRTHVFFDDRDRQFYLNTLKLYSQEWELDIWAYCLMTNHVHILAVPSSDESLSRSIGRANLVYTQYTNRKYNRSGRLWQNRFFSTIVETEPYLWAVVRYIEYNPVRAGIVKNPEQYRWSSCNAHVTGIADELLAQKGWLDEVSRKQYKDFLKTEDRETEQAIRRATSTGRPLGSEGFIKRIEKELSRRLLPSKAGRPRKDTTK